MIEQARPSLGVLAFEQPIRTGADRERPQEKVECLADGVGVGVGTEVLGPLAFLAPHHPGPGPFVGAGDGQIGIGLVVDQADVEAGPVTFDERVLQHQRLDLVVGDDPLDGVGVVDHGLGACGQTPGEIGGDPGPQRLGLADVYHLAVPITEQIGAGCVGYLGGAGSFPHASKSRKGGLPPGSGQVPTRFVFGQSDSWVAKNPRKETRSKDGRYE